MEMLGRAIAIFPGKRVEATFPSEPEMWHQIGTKTQRS
jgi:hypothetical protein